MLCLIMLASVFMLSACSKDDSTNPFHEFITDSQKLKLEQLAEAFAEGGYNFSSSTPISFMDMEKFIYFYYNDKVIADEDSKLASLDEETASAFITATFGTGGNELHYNFGEIGGALVTIVLVQLSGVNLAEDTRHVISGKAGGVGKTVKDTCASGSLLRKGGGFESGKMDRSGIVDNEVRHE